MFWSEYTVSVICDENYKSLLDKSLHVYSELRQNKNYEEGNMVNAGVTQYSYVALISHGNNYIKIKLL